MKRFFLFSSVALIVLIGCSRQDEPSDQPITTAGVTCLQPTWHIGEFDPRSVRTHHFKLTNNTNSPIGIAKIRSDCDCIVAREKAEEIPAGGDVEIEVELKTSLKPGSIRRTVVVQLATDPVRVIPLRIIGHASPTGSLKASPSVLDFGRLDKGDRRTRKLRVMRFDGSAVSGVKLDTTKIPLYSSHVDLLEGGRVAEISLVIAGDATDGGEFTDNLTISREPLGIH